MPRKEPPVTIRIPTLEDYALRGGRMPFVDFGEGSTIGKYRSNRLEGDPANINKLQSYKKGGKVKKTGLAKLHKGERVLTATAAKKLTPAKVRAARRKPVARTRKR